ncbi:hypothetical protein MMC25_003684 [Agyrium rufum]|nr:hypothetical protein [Agyrium rufum]
MAGTRSLTRAQANGSSPQSSQESKAVAGNKRKADSADASTPKRGKKSGEKQQKTIEESLPDEPKTKDIEMNGSDTEQAEHVEQPAESTQKPIPMTDASLARVEELEKREQAVLAREKAADAKDGTTATTDSNGKDEAAEAQPETEQSNSARSKHEDTSKMDSTGAIEPIENTKSNQNGSTAAEGGAVEESASRADQTPSSILEKGIIYFFFRGRVGIDEPSDVGDIARSYIVLRPLPHGAKLGDGPIGDAGKNRILALPKKVLPKSARDRFMVFVEKANSSLEDIKKDVLAPSDYATKTAGTRHTPAATPIAEGIYAITTQGRETHLAYILTIPSKVSEVQKDMGLNQQGSFVTSTKNPQYAGPANTNLPQGPDFPQEILDEFRSLRWAPLQPKYLDYENTQLLLIGSGVDDLSKATEQQPKDDKHDKDTPLEEMERLEREDEIRIEHLKGDDSVFEDLGLSSKEYPKVPSTW